MKQKTEKELRANYDKFLAIVKKYFTGERLERLLHMYSESELGGNLTVSPASGNAGYHNCYPGGYIDHIFNVCRNALKVKAFFTELGGKPDFTDEELIFCALHHDLGKLGTKGNMHYVLNESEWHVKNKGEVYTKNPNMVYMTITDRTFFTLQHYGIRISEKEYFGIKLTDGMYDEDNTKYLKVFDPKKAMRFNLAHVMHWADHMSTVVESQENTI
ncbi:hypothetical protein UFOVP449_53 [uncultured Caudovirales phage]|uniref:Uncharacterized protein n=1 Tax=uncultured Caudovirales phage TaxID=2100421 RepID=A0A6J5M8I5_9CAUD|nr:hypothetical protein UFOVP449_53 [uncultured Caudovirales phage]